MVTLSAIAPMTPCVVSEPTPASWRNVGAPVGSAEAGPAANMVARPTAAARATATRLLVWTFTVLYPPRWCDDTSGAAPRMVAGADVQISSGGCDGLARHVTSSSLPLGPAQRGAARRSGDGAWLTR